MQKRKKENPNLIYGIQPIKEALKGNRIDKVLIKKGLNRDAEQEIKQAALEAGVPIQYVPGEKLHNLLPGINHQGAVAFQAAVPYHDLETFLEEVDPTLMLMLDGVSDVRNFGAIARTAHCMGAQAIIIPEQGSARINAEAMKTSAGALNHLAVIRVKNLTDAGMLIQAYAMKLVACTEKAENDLAEADLTGPMCIIMGDEGRGIQPKLIRLAEHSVKISLTGEIASLNVGVAAGMILYEAARQRRSAEN